MASKTVEAECEFDVVCTECGNALDADFSKGGWLKVSPCDICMDKAAEEARKE